jgi:dTMP kinase
MQVISPALARGEVILCDRFTDSTFAYQGGGRGFDWEMLSSLERWVQGTLPGAAELESARLLQPDLTLWFDLPAHVAAQRLSAARVPDKFESQPLAFFERVADGYARRMASDPVRFFRIEADQAAEGVWTDVELAIRNKGYLP